MPPRRAALPLLCLAALRLCAGLRREPLQFSTEPPRRFVYLWRAGGEVPCAAGGAADVTIRWQAAQGASTNYTQEKWTPVSSAVESPSSPASNHLLAPHVGANGSLVFPPEARLYRSLDSPNATRPRTYRCLATTDEGYVIVSRVVAVQPIVDELQASDEADENKIHVPNVSGYVGNDILLHCSVPNAWKDFVSVVSWERKSLTSDLQDHLAVGELGDIVFGDDSLAYSLHLQNIGMNDAGLYTCRVLNKLTNSSLAASGQLEVLEETNEVVAHTLIKNNSQFGVKHGHTVFLPCVAAGLPKPEYNWYKSSELGNNIRMKDGKETRYAQIGGFLKIESALFTDSGIYTCHIMQNGVEIEYLSVHLTVVEYPSIHLSPQVQHGRLHENIFFECNCRGNPQFVYEFKWLKNGNILPPSSRYNVDDNLTLLISSVNFEDTAMYQCVLETLDGNFFQSSALLLIDSLFLVESFDPVVVQPGRLLTLKCVALGSPLPLFTWTLDGVKISASDRIFINYTTTGTVSTESKLVIKHVTMKDAGRYSCVATNPSEIISHSEIIRVFGRPYVESNSYVSVKEGETAILPCSTSGYPIHKVTWEKDGERLPKNESHQMMLPNGSLLLENAKGADDQGVYGCTAFGSDDHTASGNVTLTIQSNITLIPFNFPNTTLNEGGEVSVVCHVQNDNISVDFNWKKDGVATETTADTIIEIDGNSSRLALSNISLGHNGVHTCAVTDQKTTSQHSALLLVRTTLKWLMEPMTQNVLRGSSLKIPCRAEGFPSPDIVTWRKFPQNLLKLFPLTEDNLPAELGDLVPFSPAQNMWDTQFTPYVIQNETKSLYVTPNGTLVIDSAQIYHEGRYSCVAENRDGRNLIKRISIVVDNPPVFVGSLPDIVVEPGDNAILTCEATSETMMNITWTAKGKEYSIESVSRIQIYQKATLLGIRSVLTINSLLDSEAGMYICEASNLFGNISQAVEVAVGQVPDAPGDLHINRSIRGSCVIEWTAPFDGGLEIQNYIITYKRSSSSWNSATEVVVDGQTTVTQIPSWKCNYNYDIRVRAKNKIGLSKLAEN